MVDIVSLVSTLQDASYAGVPFLYVDSNDEPGRRTLRFLFPGSDLAAFQDLGQDDGTIRITGLLIGDDYIRQANALRDAFQTPGPATLVHPWLGELQVVLAQRPKFEDAQDKLRCTRFEAEFWRFLPRLPEPPGTLDALLAAADALRTAARALLAQILTPLALAVSVVGYVTRFASQAAGWFTIVTGGGLQGIVGASLANLSGIGALSPASGYAASVATLLGAPSAALAAASNPPVPAAVGPGQASTTATAVDGRVTVAAMLAVVASAAAAMADPTPGPELSVALRATILADAVQAASDIAFVSAQEAAGWRDRVAAALDAAADDAALAASQALAPASPESLGAAWDALVTLRADWLADMNAVIGRLPAVALLHLPAPAPAWLIAAYAAGDDPTQVVPALQDLATRNGLRRLGLVTQATVEVLA